MSNEKKELAVAALRRGTVIDHIPSSAVFKAVKILGLEDMPHAVTIGCNLASKKLGSKGIIKVSEHIFDKADLDRIALIAPTAVVNIIEDYNVVEKRPVSVPDTITGIVRCTNPKCITNNEPMATKFDVVAREPEIRIRCRYCNHTYTGSDAKIL
ncbi:MAG: aspartate carbamoyltransferase regulatory subunit [Muribaculaceae bacterium]|nr:aspartate carbamoyltransferase regulatory subunit [Muribaculaceae bacterium]